MKIQPGIYLRPAHTYSLQFDLHAGFRKDRLISVCRDFFRQEIVRQMVVGVGEPLLNVLNRPIEGLASFSKLTSNGITYPATQSALWLLLQGEGPGVDPGVLVVLARHVVQKLQSEFVVSIEQPAYTYKESRDLAGFRDGTENPGEVEKTIAIPSQQGGTFALVQRWVHNLDALNHVSRDEMERLVGRRIPRDASEPDLELENLPSSAHVLRTKQEEAGYMYRRSQAFGTRKKHGLQFIGYSSSLDIFDKHLRRMIGLDGPPDDLSRFSNPDTGAYLFCPGVRPDGILDSSWFE